MSTHPAGRGILPALPVAALLLALPWVDGGRTGSGSLLLVAGAIAAAVASVPALRANLRLPVLVAAFLVPVLSWASIAWSACADSTIAAALRWSSLGVLLAVLSATLHARATQLVVVVGLLGGVLVSAVPVSFQVLAAVPGPAHWLDPVFRDAIAVRVSGPMDNPNVLAGYLGYALPMLVALAILWTGPVGTLSALGVATGGCCLLLTYSRAGWLAAMLGCAWTIVLSCRDRSLRCLVHLVPAIACLMLIVTINLSAVSSRVAHTPSPGQGTFDHRLFMWRAGLRMLSEHPVTGVGVGAYSSAYGAARPTGVLKPYALVLLPGSAHSDYVQLAAEGGGLAIAVALFIAAVVVTQTRSTRSAVPGDGTRALLVGGRGTIVAALVGGIAQSHSLTPLCVLLLVVALASVCAASTDKRSRATPPKRPACFTVAVYAGLAALATVAALRYSAALEYSRAARAVAQGHVEPAFRALERSRMLNPASAAPHVLAGDIWSAEDLARPSARSLGAALLAYRAAAQRSPCSAPIRCRIGDVLERQGRYADALIEYRRACELDWYRGSYHIQVARIAAAHAGAIALAESHLEAALALLPLEVALEESRHGTHSRVATALRRAESEALSLYRALCPANTPPGQRGLREPPW